MLDLPATESDRRPVILICAWDSGDEVWDPVENLSGDEWTPPGARSLTLDAAEPDALLAIISDWLSKRGSRALLLVGRAPRGGDDFMVQLRAERLREDGEAGGFTEPSVARVTAPAALMLRALHEEGLPASASSNSEDDAGSELLFRLLTALPDGDAPAIGLLRVPEGASLDLSRKGVKAVAAAMASCLAPMPRQSA